MVSQICQDAGTFSLGDCTFDMSGMLCAAATCLSLLAGIAGFSLQDPRPHMKRKDSNLF